MLRSFSFIVLLLVLTACPDDISDVPNFPVDEVEGYSPIYISSKTALAGVTLQSTRGLSNPGKIYTIGKYLLISDQLNGVHVYDNTDPTHPVSVGFLNIMGNTDVAIRGKVLYANNLTDLVAVDLADPNNVKEISRFPQDYWSPRLPPATGTYFECVDSTKGVILGWQRQKLTNPKCYR